MSLRPLLNRTIFFLVFNFLALYLGVLLMNNGPQTDWYTGLNKAPWSPPSWMFGVAWTTIMIAFSFYMSILSLKVCGINIRLIALYSLQWVLNVGWNYVFFNRHNTTKGLIAIVLLTILIICLFVRYYRILKVYSLLIVPYLIWMLIATSLNWFIVYNN